MSEVGTSSKILTLRISQEDYIEKYLLLWKGYLNLTNSDISVLKEFIIIFRSINNTNEDLAFIEVFNKENRKVVADRLGISEYSFNNIFMRLKNEKGIIQKTRYGYRLNPKVLPVDEITFKFKIDGIQSSTY
jgi:hypothetical protein